MKKILTIGLLLSVPLISYGGLFDSISNVADGLTKTSKNLRSPVSKGSSKSEVSSKSSSTSEELSKVSSTTEELIKIASSNISYREYMSKVKSLLNKVSYDKNSLIGEIKRRAVNNNDASLVLASLYIYGFIHEFNSKTKGEELFKKVADDGNTIALEYIGRENMRENTTKGVEYLSRSASQGSSSSQYYLWEYFKDRDEKQAEKWGLCYIKNTNIPKTNRIKVEKSLERIKAKIEEKQKKEQEQKARELARLSRINLYGEAYKDIHYGESLKEASEQLVKYSNGFIDTESLIDTSSSQRKNQFLLSLFGQQRYIQILKDFNCKFNLMSSEIKRDAKCYKNINNFSEFIIERNTYSPSEEVTQLLEEKLNAKQLSARVNKSIVELSFIKGYGLCSVNIEFEKISPQKILDILKLKYNNITVIKKFKEFDMIQGVCLPLPINFVTGNNENSAFEFEYIAKENVNYDELFASFDKKIVRGFFKERLKEIENNFNLFTYSTKIKNKINGEIDNMIKKYKSQKEKENDKDEQNTLDF